VRARTDDGDEGDALQKTLVAAKAAK